MKPARLPFMDGLFRAIMAREKTVTRRLVAGAVASAVEAFELETGEWAFSEGQSQDDGSSLVIAHLSCKYGPVGRVLAICEGLRAAEWFAGDARDDDAVQYTADGDYVWDVTRPAQWPWKVRRLASMYCPTWAVRTRRRVTSIRPERLSAITDAEARLEGLSFLDGVEPTRDGFLSLWDGMYAARGQGIAADPWVWRVEFEEVT